MRSYAKERAAERIAELSARGQDVVTFWRECTEVLEAAVPHYDKPCWYTLDPASSLITSHYHDGLTELPAEMLNHEYYGDDVNQISDVARSDSGISTLHEATGGDPSSSRTWQLNMAMGGDQEMIAALRTGGAVWGAVGLYRAPGEPMFDRAEKAFLQAIGPDLATGARTGLLIGEARDPPWPDSPGLVVLAEDGEVESTTPGVERWLCDLPDGDFDAGRLPSAVYAVAGRALRTAESRDDPGEVALARVLSRSGTWIVLHGTSLVASGSRRAAVIVEPAHPARITPLLMSAYGLTEREQEVTRLVLRGDSTAQISDRLVVSAHTVQEHLKNIFEKTGVRSRRELVGKVFFVHYEPRLRDNERRVVDGDPVRGGPVPPDRESLPDGCLAAMTSTLPPEVQAVFDRFVTTEFTTVDREGQPIPWPVTPYYRPGAPCIDVTTGLGYPKKADDAAANRKVALLFSDPTGCGLEHPPQVLVQGTATVQDRDLDANRERYARESVEKLPHLRTMLPRPRLRRLFDWCFTRIYVQVRPERVYVWPDADPSREPQLLDTHMEEVRSGHDEEPPGFHAAAVGGEAAWDERCEELGPRYPTAVLSIVAPDGFPFSLRVPIEADSGARRLRVGAGALGLPVQPGLACVTAHAHGPRFEWQTNFQVRGDLVEDERGWAIVPHRLVGGFELPPGTMARRYRQNARRILRYRATARRELRRRGGG